MWLLKAQLQKDRRWGWRQVGEKKYIKKKETNVGRDKRYRKKTRKSQRVRTKSQRFREALFFQGLQSHQGGSADKVLILISASVYFWHLTDLRWVKKYCLIINLTKTLWENLILLNFIRDECLKYLLKIQCELWNKSYWMITHWIMQNYYHCIYTPFFASYESQ